MRLSLPLLLVLAACSPTVQTKVDDTAGGTDGTTTGTTGTDTTTTGTGTGTGTSGTTGTDTTTTGTTTDTCTVHVDRMSPADGDTDVAVDTTVVVTYDQKVTAATVTLDNGGRPVRGSVTIAPNGMSAVFTPDQNLDAATTYTATASACGIDTVADFTTVDNTLDLTGYTYVLDLGGKDITWNDPSSSVASLLLSLGTTPVLLFGVQSYSGGNLDLIGSVGEVNGGVYSQYPCTAPFDFDPTTASGGKFSAGPLDSSMVVAGTALDMYDFAANGKLAADGSEITNLQVTGKVDIGPVLTSNGYSCSQLAMFGVSCVDCGNGTKTCINMDFEDASSPYDPSITIDPTYPDLSNPECK